MSNETEVLIQAQDNPIPDKEEENNTEIVSEETDSVDSVDSKSGDADTVEENNSTPVSETASKDKPANDDINSLPDDIIITDYIALKKAEADEKKKRKLHLPIWLKNIVNHLLHNKKIRISLICVLIVVFLILLIIFGGQTLIDRAMRIVRYSGDTTEFTFDAHSSNSYHSFRDGLAVASVSGLLCLDKNGEEIALIQNRTDPPALLENGTVALSYGVGGTSIAAIHYKKGEILNQVVPGTIIDADLSPDSCICFANVQSGYKTVLSVLNNHGENIYSWYSSTRFFTQCALSKKAAYLAAIAIGQEDGIFESQCFIFATDREDPIASVSLGSDLIYDLRFINDHRLCAVGETALHYFNIDGSDCSQYSFENGDLLSFDLHADNFVAIVRNVNEAGSRFRVATVGNDGKQIAELAIDDEIVDINANGRYLAILTPTSLLVFDRHLKLCLREDNIGFATHICVQKDGAVLLIDGATAHRIS